jgi:hypothetical protein
MIPWTTRWGRNGLAGARISMIARSVKAPLKGRIQMRKTNTASSMILAARRGRSIQERSGATLPLFKQFYTGYAGFEILMLSSSKSKPILPLTI